MFKKTDILFYKEAISLAFVITASASLIVVIARLASLTDLLFATSNIFRTLGLVFFYLLPSILTTVFPIAIFAACALISTRMATDRETDALFSSGMSLGQILLAPFVFGVCAMLLMIGNSFYYDPYAKTQFQFFRWFQTQKFVETFLANNLREKTFIAEMPLIDNNTGVFYADSLTKTNQLSNVFIALQNAGSSQTEDIIIAKQGGFVKTSAEGPSDFIFTLLNGTIYAGAETTAEFDKIELSLVNTFGTKLIPPDNRQINDKPKLNKSLKPVAAALCTIFFPGLGICLGLSSSNKKPKPFLVYFGIGIVTILFYALLALPPRISLAFGISEVYTYTVPPLFFSIATFLFVRERYKIK